MKSKILLIGLLLFLFTSCDSLLKEESFDFIQPGDIEDSDAGLDLWTNGVYKTVYWTVWDIFPTLREQDSDYNTGPVWIFGNLGTGNFQGEIYAERLWSEPYITIAAANNAIKGISAMTKASQDKKNSALGEMYFLKAWQYFFLVRDFGPVPIYRTADELAVHHPRCSVAEVYEYIIELLKQAESMAFKNTDPNSREGRITAGAAASLLSKVYLTMASGAKKDVTIVVKGGPAVNTALPNTPENPHRFTTEPIDVFCNKTKSVAGYEAFDADEYFRLARDKAKQVIDGDYGSYALFTNDWKEIWKTSNENVIENIWSFQSSETKPAYKSTVSKYSSGTWSANNVTLDKGAVVGGYATATAVYGCTYHWYSLFEDDVDERVVNGVLHSWQSGNTTESSPTGFYYPATPKWQERADTKVAPWFTLKNVSAYNPSAPHAILTKKFFRSDKVSESSEMVYPYIRMAEVYLIYAEAKNEVDGPNTDALEYINRVRTRSNATPFRIQSGTTGRFDIADQDEFRSCVIEERARELAFENGDRRYDLLRWGLYLAAMNSFKGVDELGLMKEREAKHLLFPIPKGEIATNELINENNPGWK